MKKSKFILSVLSTSNRDIYTPAQIQKLFFLIDRNIPEYIGGPKFNFQPYGFGPFDKDVYQELKELERNKEIEIIYDKWNNYRLTNKGQEKGLKSFKKLKKKAKSYIQKISNFVRSVSFSELISSIYKEYPEMRKNSVFQN